MVLEDKEKLCKNQYLISRNEKVKSHFRDRQTDIVAYRDAVKRDLLRFIGY